MNWSDLISSAVVAAIVAGIVALLTSERRLAAENVIQERKDWREHIRRLAEDVNHSIISGESDANKFRELRAMLALRLNPHDADDQEILALVEPAEAAHTIVRANEFNQRVGLLLKHDWERAKREANLLLLLCATQPARVKFKDYQPGDGRTYTRWRCFF